MNKRITAIFLALCTAICLPGTVCAATDKTATTVHISTAYELQSYAKKCIMDSFSENTTVLLDNDIDLQGKPFSPFPSFSGTFEGNEHTISGFVNAENGSNEGLFRYIEESGTVKDLTVTGQELAGKGKKEIGGIAGTNYGLIENCRFSGTVTGQEMVGGICGANYGRVVYCWCDGTVSGKTMVGGLCGYNNGSIYNCLNLATVNPAVWEGDSTNDLSSLNLSGISKLEIADIISANSSDTTTDVGGIVGFSDYIVYTCNNYGTVGYQHYGYNIGGIAGRQSNFVSLCENYGSVYGRNDVGGIVGQNEPYMDLTDRMTMAAEIQSLSDTFDYSMDTLSKNTDAASGIIADIGEDTQDTLDSTEAALNDKGRFDALEGAIEEDFGIETELNDMEHIQINEEETLKEEDPTLVDKALDRTKTTTSNMDSDYISGVWNSAQNAEKEDAWNVALDAVSGAGITSNTGNTGNISGRASEFKNKSTNAVGSDTVNNVLSGDVSDEDISNIVVAGTDTGAGKISSTTDSITLRRAQRKAEEAAEDARFTDDVTRGGNSLKRLGDDFSDLGVSIWDTMNNLTTNFMEVNEHFTNVMNMMADALAGNFNRDIMKDVSEIRNSDSLHGTVLNSANYGNVSGDECVGGIAGAMSIETDYDLNGVISDSLASNGIFSNTYETTCIIRACENNGTVNSKYDNNGGIVGKQDIGLIINSENYGDIDGTGKNYGGVVGLSYSTVNTCYSKCTVSGTDYVGGIAGTGSVIYDCISLSTIPEADGAFVGAIAGYADMDAEREVEIESGISADAVALLTGSEDEEEEYTFVQEKCVSGNYFVDDALGGVNGVSYTDLAEPVDYLTAMSYAELPEKLRKWEITFVADGNVVAVVEFDYGGSITEIPKVPAKEGYTGFWEDFETENLTACRTVNAEYIRSGNAVESDALRENSGLPTVLVEGAIAGDTEVKVYFRNYTGEKLSGRKVLEVVTVELPEQTDASGEYLLHYNPPAGKKTVTDIFLLGENGKWRRVQAAEQGSYLVFRSQVPVTFAAVREPVDTGTVILAAALSAAITAAGLVLLRRRGKNTDS